MTTASIETLPCGHPREVGARYAGCPRCLLDLALAAPEPEPIPELVGPYKIIKPLGFGAMGSVYQAEQPVIKQLVAVKTIRADIQLDESTLAQLRREIEILGQLRHPNIVKIYQTDLEADPPYFVMEWIEGGSLDQEAQRRRFANSESAARLMYRVAEAVQSAHESSVFHRDIKPANILVDASGNPRVSDFGVAKLADRDTPSTVATFAGTLPYMSPEQAGIVEAPIAAASDVYALGATLYFLLTGKTPYEASTLEELHSCFNSGPPRKPSSLVPGVNADLERVCMAALARSLDDRYRTAADFARDLKRVLEDRPPEPPRQLVSKWRKLKSAVQRHPSFSVIAVLGAALVATDVTMFVKAGSQQTIEASFKRNNVLLAKVQARALLAILEVEASALVRATESPAVEALFNQPRPINPALALHNVSPTFDTVFILDPAATVFARFPASDPKDFSQTFAYRDYFIGATKLKRSEVYFSRTFHSLFTDNNLKFALATPMRDESDKLLGVFVGSYAATHSFKGLRKLPFRDQPDGDEDQSNRDQIVAVLGPRETLPDASATPPTYMAVLHPELKKPGEEKPLRSDISLELQKRFPRTDTKLDFDQSDAKPYMLDDYEDPILHGTWLAAIVPIGHTGYAVVAQTRAQVSDEYAASTVAHVLMKLSLAFLVIVAAAGFVTFRRRRERWRSSDFD